MGLGRRAFDGVQHDGTKKTWKLLRSWRTVFAAGDDSIRSSAFHRRRHINLMGWFESSVTEKPSGSMELAESTSKFPGILSLLDGTAGDSTNPDMREGFRRLGVEVDGGCASSKEGWRKESWCGRARRGHSGT
jgi:hypothetical protein